MEKDFLQISHSWGLRPSCTAATCMFTSLFSVRVFGHWGQLTDERSWTPFTCWLRWDLYPNDVLHKSHWNGLRPSWTLVKWFVNKTFEGKVLLHSRHWNGLSPFWTLLKCISNLCFYPNLFLRGAPRAWPACAPFAPFAQRFSSATSPVRFEILYSWQISFLRQGHPSRSRARNSTASPAYIPFTARAIW